MEILFAIAFIWLLYILPGWLKALAFLGGIMGVLLVFTGPSPVTLIAGAIFLFVLGMYTFGRMMG
jgi:hypothetical protein